MLASIVVTTPAYLWSNCTMLEAVLVDSLKTWSSSRYTLSRETVTMERDFLEINSDMSLLNSTAFSRNELLMEFIGMNLEKTWSGIWLNLNWTKFVRPFLILKQAAAIGLISMNTYWAALRTQERRRFSSMEAIWAWIQNLAKNWKWINLKRGRHLVLMVAKRKSIQWTERHNRIKASSCNANRQRSKTSTQRTR